MPKYIVSLHAPAEAIADVEVEADSQEEAEELALEQADEADWELDVVRNDQASVECSSEDE